ncbi:MAG TPA: tol-pal system-associated acyl-CoA thioesterase [Steroidobacteraceae bacterium]|nr:tol-pal system-associated acyl-CoA thioesterase [Steroidobacteraceae bacterium]
MSGFTWRSRVYWEDTDAGGIVYYANYFRFLERARTEWLRGSGVSQRALALDPGVVFSVVALQAHYHRPARLDDVLLISCEPQRQGGASIEFKQRIWRGPAGAAGAGEELLLTASVRVACLDARTMKPRRLPAVIAGGLP